MTKKNFIENLKRERQILADALAKIVDLNTDGNEDTVKGLESLIAGYDAEIELVESIN